MTVGSYTLTASELLLGTTTANNPTNPTGLMNVDDFSLDTFSNEVNSGGYHRTQTFGGNTLYTSTNGSLPDFFYFELGGNDAISLQAILSDGSLGQTVTQPNSTWNATGYTHSTNSQNIAGIAFDVTDLRDASGLALSASTSIRGFQINGTGNDPVSIFAAAPTLAPAVVPEPGSLALWGGMGVLALGFYLRRRALQE